MVLAHGSFGWDLRVGERHAASHLSGVGYETHLFGLQHVSPIAEGLGFDHVHGQGTGRDVSDEVVAFLDLAGRERRLYVEVNLFEPHRPYDYGGIRPDTSRGVYVPGYLPQGHEARDEMAALQGAIRETDANVGRILAAIDGRDADDSLVVFTADHGIAMPRAKCTLYDAGIEVALIVRWPSGELSGGVEVAGLVGNVDVLPTVLEAVGAECPQHIQGRSALGMARAGTDGGRDAVFAEKSWHSYYDPMRAIRTQRFKLIRNFEAGFAVEVPADIQRGALFRSFTELYSKDRAADVELYDLDPLEQHNLAGAPELKAIERDLDERLWEWMTETSDPLLDGAIASPRYERVIGTGGRE
jgi:arylsulfatase A-like enzyme